MAVSKRTRFEVLRRDNFTCRYCRSTEGELTVDHVVPKALGGSDDPSNLVAACRDCNAGKASASPGDETVADVAEDALRWSRAIEMAAQQRAKKSGTERQYVDWFIGVWEGSMPPFAHLPDVAEVRQTVMRFFGLGLGPEETVDAVETAAAASHVYQSARWKYFCGICWNKVNALQEAARLLVENGDV